MTQRGSFGTAWERYPIREGEIWQAGPHRVLCGDLTVAYRAGAFGHLLQGQRADVVYTDPPWNPANAEMFHSFIGQKPAYSYDNFLLTMASMLREVCPFGIVALSMGMTWHERFEAVLREQGAATLGAAQTWYQSGGGHKQLPCWLWIGTFHADATFNPVAIPAGIGGAGEIAWIAQMFCQPGTRFLDPCCGVGTFPLAAMKQGATVFGCELLPRKLANFLTAKAMQRAGEPHCVEALEGTEPEPIPIV